MNWREAFETKVESNDGLGSLPLLEADLEEAGAILRAGPGEVVPVADVGAKHLAAGNPLLQLGREVVNATKDPDSRAGDGVSAEVPDYKRTASYIAAIGRPQDAYDQAGAAAFLFALKGIHRRLLEAAAKVGASIETIEHFQSIGRNPTDLARIEQILTSTGTADAENQGEIPVAQGMSPD